MRIKLDARFVKKLMSLPETGMGYRRVDLHLSDGREVRDVVVFDAEEVELPDAVGAVAITDVRLCDR